MIELEPMQYFVAKLFCKCKEFFGILLRSSPGHIVFNGVPFDAAGIEIRGIGFALGAKDHWKCR